MSWEARPEAPGDVLDKRRVCEDQPISQLPIGLRLVLHPEGLNIFDLRHGLEGYDP